MISPTQALIGHIYVDAVRRQIPSEPMKVTKHPIEDGTIVSEHIAEEDNTLVLECTFTDDVYAVTTGGATNVTTATSADDKRKAIYKLKRDRSIFNIETMKDHYSNMALVDIEEDITPQNVLAFRCTLYFEQVKTATTKTAAVSLERIKKKTAAKKAAGLKQEPTQDQGQQSPSEITDDREAEAAIDDVPGSLGLAS